MNRIVKEHYPAIETGCAYMKSSGQRIWFLRGVRLILPDESGVSIIMDALSA